MKRSDKTLYLTELNVLSCLSVVLLHCNGVFWSRPEGRLWITSNFIETFFYFSVPVFFMISGATLFDYSERYSTREYFRKRFHKAVIPFFIWSIIGFIYLVLKGSVRSEDINILHILDGVLNTRYTSIYWFFIPLFGFYLSIPILENIKDKIQWFQYGIALGFLFVVTLPFISSLIGMTYNWALAPSVVNSYILYAMVGYVLSRKDISRIRRWAIYAFGFVGWVMHFLGTIISSPEGQISDIFKGYLNLPCFLHACAVFVLVKYISISRNERYVKILNWFAKRTFGIYLVHIYLVWEIPARLHFETGNIIWRTAGAVIVFALSAGIVWIIQQIPVLKRMVP